MNARARMIAGGWVVVPVVLSALFSPAAAQHPIPENQRWATITHAGNAPFNLNPLIDQPPHQRGSVNYEYQISRTEVTAAEWFEFVQAYAPYVSPDDAGNGSFTSNLITVTTIGPNQFSYSLLPARVNFPVTMSWRFAARYCNWLHNNKAPEQEAFERGAYDTSTFGSHPAGGFTDQRERSPGAQYFIPTIDEWTKAAYWDPNRHGEGMPGYWQYPHGADVPPIAGVPGVGQTNRGTGRFYPVASYMNTQSPWGLLDLSGGEIELLENTFLEEGTGVTRLRAVKGTWRVSQIPEQDRLSWLGVTSPNSSAYGLRLARVVPAPSSLVLMSAIAIMVARRRRSVSCSG